MKRSCQRERRFEMGVCEMRRDGRERDRVRRITCPLGKGSFRFGYGRGVWGIRGMSLVKNGVGGKGRARHGAGSEIKRDKKELTILRVLRQQLRGPP